MFKASDHFGFTNGGASSPEQMRRFWFIKARDDHERRRETVSDKNEAMFDAASALIIASDEQIRAFEARLDLYGTRLDAFEEQLDIRERAITAALMKNHERLELIEQQLAEINSEVDLLLKQAFILPDGRRVFKSEDGSYVIDENGDQISKEEIEFEDIDGPSAETYQDRIDARESLKQEQNAILEDNENLYEAQEKLDGAREKLGAARHKLEQARDAVANGDLTMEEIEAMEAELESVMPTAALPALPKSALQRLEGSESTAQTISAKEAFVEMASPANDPQNSARSVSAVVRQEFQPGT